jgi:two-component system, LytTR family, sensor kinase
MNAGKANNSTEKTVKTPSSKAWLLVGAGWLLPGLYYAVQVYLQQGPAGPGVSQPTSVTTALMHGIVFWFLWAVSTPLIVLLARTFPLEGERWTDGLQFHLPAGLIFSLLHLLAYVMITASIEARHLPDSFEVFLKNFQTVFFRSFAWWSLVYWAVLIASYAWDYHARYRSGLLRASQLETELSQAELRALRMQLHPHFLFNTLNSISALLHTDKEAADRMIARLGDFLRLTLSSQSSHQVTLAEELRFLECYLSIERERFRERLRVSIEIEPEAMSSRVPHLLLQPMVENAIRHGIAHLERPGSLAVRARTDGSYLKIEVEDDGPGLDETLADDGVGFRNTRSRLEALYGANHRFSLSRPAGGGLLVTIELPLELEYAYV